MTTLISRESALCLNECGWAAAYLERAQRDGVGAAQEVNGGQSVLGFKAGDKYTGAPRCARPRPAHYVLPGAELVCARTNDLEGWREGWRERYHVNFNVLHQKCKTCSSSCTAADCSCCKRYRTSTTGPATRPRHFSQPVATGKLTTSPQAQS